MDGVRLVSLFDLAILLYNAQRAVTREDCGWLDAKTSYERLQKKLLKEIWVEDELLESLLAACNFLKERRAFWHPDPVLGFEAYANSLLRKNERFNLNYNWIERISK